MKSKYLILSLIAILLGLSYYNQALPGADEKPLIPEGNKVIAEQGKAKSSTNKFEQLQDSNFPDPNTQNFEEILKQAAEKTEIEEETSASVKSGNQIASNVVVGNRGNEISSGTYSGESARAGGAAELDALREAAELFNARDSSSLIPGARVSGGSSAPDINPPEAVVQPTATPSNELKEVTGQARGYTMLYLMHPKARQTVDKQVDAMLRSKVQQLYIGVLTDGTFGKDFNYFSNVVRRIAREKRSLVLSVYLTNGSTMRDESELVEAPFADYDPIEFRTAIRINPVLREEYINLIKPVIPVLQLNKRLNASNRNYVTVMLEDNLDDESYTAMRQMAQPLVGNRASFIRNPCGGDGCPEGSTSGGVGDPLEVHDLEKLPTLAIQDAFSLDGTGYRLPGETEERIPSFEEVKSAAITAASRGIKFFGLWRFERQGNKLGEAMQPVNERTFEVPSEAAIQAEIEILRAGLTVVD